MPFDLKVQFSVIECARCGLPFAITSSFMAIRKRDHKSFVCPSGHKNYFNSKTEAEAQRDRADCLQHQLDQLKEYCQDMTQSEGRIADVDPKVIQ